ncbi:MAG TPA: SUMF1/EgtB/PvdO family nonheme iron enzyme [Flavipsychrobacter sp.]|jgi:formylglycine-generating enzyme required for sulfatase activity|nr:SUMF1/EgtB/PvdO family nonheme iron enzyme [Flavipsychrobacter sp.]
MKKLVFLVVAILAGQLVYANNITVSNVIINGQNTGSHFSLVNFDIAWENSWRTSTNESNYDGAWVFVKFRKKNAFVWQHATINYGTNGTAASAGHTQPTGSTVQTPADGKGVWIYRDANGSGYFNLSNVKLRWNYGVDGVADNDSVEVVVYAVEMVYVPQGSFVLGSNGTEYYHLRRGDKDTCFAVNSESSITVGTTSSHLASTSTSYLQTGTIAAAYPKGYGAFWCMKYEISQQQYADFLNNIDNAKATTRDPGGFSGTHPSLTAPQPERALGWLNQEDVWSFLDWSAMRPMTEFEYEKACRGANQMPIANEYAWGNTTLVNIATPTDLGLSTETWATGNCNLSNSAPARCGALATGSTNRSQSGATFYGIMEMSGNIFEGVVNALTDGRGFTGLHGDGYLNASGVYDVSNWPTSGNGYGLRGGSYQSTYSYTAQVCDRLNYSYGNSRYANTGGRGVRKAE